MIKFSTYTVSKATGLSDSNLRFLCKRRKLKKTGNRYYLDVDMWLNITKEKHHENILKLVGEVKKKELDVIYVHTTWEIRESKLNFMEL